ncbi:MULTISPECIES: lipase maturation factor family protein [unclassified Streptomyces]|uniref:lipase maturation factor family protein n=1 Tax=unclassified Streptomyces TaxID=2593676 RepID=UPI001EDC57CF|nr:MULTISPECIES: lipase maturation factor family protein [unclassified Streptomyces]UKL04522.1 lipase maturation factor family protein [Streptomyces sp. NBU3104]
MEWFAAPEYWLSRLVFQRLLALLYLVAFLTTALQFRALSGSRGMTPVRESVTWTQWRHSPSLLLPRRSDRLTACCAWAGCALSAALLAGADQLLPLWGAMLLWTAPWVLYLSFVNTGSLWYGFGWELLILEAGFLAVLLGNDRVAPPLPVLLLLRWALFRLEFGAGLIKWRGDRCWRELTCLYHHHETQPMPGPLSRLFHLLPRRVHRMEAAANHVVQLGVPFLLFTPQPVAGAAACLMIATQLWLVASGNFAWLNWLTIALAVTALDLTPLAGDRAFTTPPLWYVVVVCAATAGLLALSYRPARNLFSRQQAMNRSWDPLRLVNSYGAFGTVSRVRHELVVEGTDDPAPGPGTRWLAYEFRGKPGDPARRPRQFAPYHLRLDWMMWFAALSPAFARPWFDGFLERLLTGDRDTLRLLRHSPFPPDAPPVHVRVLLYRYRFTTREERRATGDWWHRTFVREQAGPTRLSGGPGGRT